MSTLRDMARTVCIRVWGFRPVRQIKPVHLANGLFRFICGQAGNPSRLHKAAGGFREGNSRTSTDDLLREYPEVFHFESRFPSRDQVNDLRSALDLVLSQDRSLFAGTPYTLTLTHWLHTSSDPSDEGTGEFLARLLVGHDSGRIVSVLRSYLESTNDNVYTLTAPLLSARPLGSPPNALGDLETRLTKSPVLGSIQRAFEVLVMHAPFLEKTEFLQRIVTLGSFSLFMYLVNTEHPHGGRVPLLLCAPTPSDQVREASRSTFVRARQKIQQAFELGLRDELRAGGQGALSTAAYKELFRSWLPEVGQDTKDGRKQKQIWQHFVQDFDSYLLGNQDPFDSFVSASVPAMFTDLLADPPEVGTTIGRLCGLVYPRNQGRGEKYFSPSPAFLDMLVTAMVEPNEEISIEEFWDRAWQHFGLICGAKGSLDTQRLVGVGVRQASPVHMDDNAKAVLSQLAGMGHAKQLPDDVAMIRGIGRQRG